MARIRSIHPGLFTDEAFVVLSMTARVLYVGTLTEADDHGVFEWKPVRLKIRLMPVDAVDVPALLGEMVECGSVKKFTSEGKSYGLVRNFCRYQRPKKPKYTFPLPSEFYTYAGLKDDGSLPPLHQSGTDGEKPPQREEGGDLGKEESGIGGGAKPAPAKASRLDSKVKLTLDFTPSDATREIIRAMGFGDQQFNKEISRFHPYYTGHGTVADDWNSMLVSWFQRATPEPVAPPPAPGLAMLNKVFVVVDTLGWKSWVTHIKETRGVTWSRTIEKRDDANRVQNGWWWPEEFAPGWDPATGERVAPPENEENAA
jgi:hypothetical protein